jgi:hypothetical protein
MQLEGPVGVHGEGSVRWAFWVEMSEGGASEGKRVLERVSLETGGRNSRGLDGGESGEEVLGQNKVEWVVPLGALHVTIRTLFYYVFSHSRARLGTGLQLVDSSLLGEIIDWENETWFHTV